MKKIGTLIFGLVMFAAFAASAKYVQPEGVKTRPEKNAAYQFSYMDKDGDGRISLEEYKSKVMTRDMEKQDRRLKKAGVYKTTEQEFKEMDTDEDGYITSDDLSGLLVKKDKILNK